MKKIETHTLDNCCCFFFFFDSFVLVTAEKTILILKLFEPAYTLAPFAPEAYENYVKVIFTKQCKLYFTLI